jgi:hypothetical protein
MIELPGTMPASLGCIAWQGHFEPTDKELACRGRRRKNPPVKGVLHFVDAHQYTKSIGFQSSVHARCELAGSQRAERVVIGQSIGVQGRRPLSRKCPPDARLAEVSPCAE